MAVFGSHLSGKRNGGIFPALDLTSSEPVSDSDLTVKEYVRSHNFVKVDGYLDGKGVARLRFTCTNPGCNKRNVPLEAKLNSTECKGAERLARKDLTTSQESVRANAHA